VTIPTARPVAPARAATLRSLGWLEARRYARHRLFLAGAALVVVATAASTDPGDPWGGTQIGPAFLLGVLGVLVGFDLTRSAQRAEEVVGATPVGTVVRAAAHCLACLVPAAAAVVWLAGQLVVYAARPPTGGWHPAVSGATVLAELLAGGVVAAAGGPLVGVLVGRWTRFPGAGLLAAAALLGWSLLSTYGLAMPASRWSTLLNLHAPYAQWVSSDGPGEDHMWLSAGSPWWHLAYVTTLCGLAATAAMLPGATGPHRARLAGVLALLGALALAGLALAVAPDPARTPL
jgi:hypothetical protein